jgi:hypothetical protein
MSFKVTKNLFYSIIIVLFVLHSNLLSAQKTGNIIGVNKPTWRIYDYNFNLVLFEERINIVHFIGGNVGLMYAT